MLDTYLPEKVPYIIYFEVIESGDLADKEKIRNIIQSIEGAAASGISCC